jgi:hypothetical protein
MAGNLYGGGIYDFSQEDLRGLCRGDFKRFRWEKSLAGHVDPFTRAFRSGIFHVVSGFSPDRWRNGDVCWDLDGRKGWRLEG